jgi:hypothetical protein
MQSPATAHTSCSTNLQEDARLAPQRSNAPQPSKHYDNARIWACRVVAATHTVSYQAAWSVHQQRHLSVYAQTSAEAPTLSSTPQRVPHPHAMNC